MRSARRSAEPGSAGSYPGKGKSLSKLVHGSYRPPRMKAQLGPGWYATPAPTRQGRCTSPRRVASRVSRSRSCPRVRTRSPERVAGVVKAAPTKKKSLFLKSPTVLASTPKVPVSPKSCVDELTFVFTNSVDAPHPIKDV